VPTPGGAPPLADDPDLARLVETWPTLGEPIRAAIRALIDVASPLESALPHAPVNAGPLARDGQG
jgi:hypothetical protein